MIRTTSILIMILFASLSLGQEGAGDPCAKACSQCQRSCEGCGAHCAKLLAEGKKEHLKTVKSCQDCASLCSAAASITARKGPFVDLVCAACADACKRCGDACAEHAEHDEVMKQCSDECRRCEKACREMLSRGR
jgi:hypothetical protein